MHNKLIPAAIAATTLLLPLAGHAQQTSSPYAGNGATGFGGALGNGNLAISADGAGNVTFTLNNASGFSGNDVVVYIDSVAGGFANTSSFSDNGDGGREAISAENSGNPSRELVTFSTGFQADYALEFENDTYDGLFQLASGGNNSLNYITGNGPSTAGGPYVVTFPLADIGLTTGQGFRFVGNLISVSAYGSNEFIGTGTASDGTTPGNNPGFSGTLTFTNADTFGTPVVAPEPSSVASLLIGAAVLGGAIVVRRRRQTA